MARALADANKVNNMVRASLGHTVVRRMGTAGFAAMPGCSEGSVLKAGAAVTAPKLSSPTLVSTPRDSVAVPSPELKPPSPPASTDPNHHRDDRRGNKQQIMGSRV